MDIGHSIIEASDHRSFMVCISEGANTTRRDHELRNIKWRAPVHMKDRGVRIDEVEYPT